MSKPHWKNASAIVREQIEALLAQPYRMTDGRMSEAQAQKQAMDLIWSYGFDCDRPEPKVSQKLAELREAKDFREINRLHLLSGASFEEEQEQRNLVRWQAMRKWASEPSAAEQAAESLAKAAGAAREAEIEARALAIVAEQNRAALERAREQARQELSPATAQQIPREAKHLRPRRELAEHPSR